MGFNTIQEIIIERFNTEETKRDKRYFLEDLERLIKELYRELEDENK